MLTQTFNMETNAIALGWAPSKCIISKHSKMLVEGYALYQGYKGNLDLKGSLCFWLVIRLSWRYLTHHNGILSLFEELRLALSDQRMPRRLTSTQR